MKITYEMSEKAFLDVWSKFDSPKEICDTEDINTFFDALIKNTKGLVIVDNIYCASFDSLTSVKYSNPYFMFVWKDFDEFRKKYLKQKLSDDDRLTWSIFSNATYDYIICDVKKLVFNKINNHLFIAVLSNYIDFKNYEKWLENKDCSIVRKDIDQNFETDYILFEGDKKDAKKHISHVGSLPFYTYMIQPKENATTAHVSSELLVLLTCSEIEERLEKAKHKLLEYNDSETEDIFDIGNRIRRILEYFLKYFCVYKDIDLKITKKYKHISLGDLRKDINKEYPQLICQKLVNTANEYSHDSGIKANKNEVLSLCNDVQTLVVEIYSRILE